MNTVIIFFAKYAFIMSVITYLVYMLSLYQSDKKKLKQFLLVSIIVFPILYLIAKISGMIISDPRPFLVTHFKPLVHSSIDNGFPSDHTLLTMGIACVIFLYNKNLGIVLAFLAILIGSARVLAGVHHWLDIGGSIVIAMIVTVIVSHLFNAFIHFQKSTDADNK